MKSPEIIQQLKKYQSLRRNQFLLQSRVARHTGKKSHATQHHCSVNGGQVLIKKPADGQDSSSDAFNVSSTSVTAQPVIKTTASDTTYSFSNGIWSKSDSAFMSFANVSNSQNAA